MVERRVYTANVGSSRLSPSTKHIMKILISDTDGYQTFVETSIPSYDIGKVSVIFYTKWKGAKNPNEYQKKFEMYLTHEELNKLRIAV